MPALGTIKASKKRDAPTPRQTMSSQRPFRNGGPSYFKTSRINRASGLAKKHQQRDFFRVLFFQNLLDAVIASSITDFPGDTPCLRLRNCQLRDLEQDSHA